MTTSQDPQQKAAAALDWARTHSRRLVYIGAALTFVAFLLPWWGITKYRVKEFRGKVVSDMTMRGEFQAYPPPADAIEGLDPDEVKELETRTKRYAAGWDSNKSLHRDFYYNSLGNGFEKELLDKENISQSSGSISLYGWSTWTGWFGVLLILAGVALFVAPSFFPQVAAWAWLVPWAWALFGLLYFVLALAFYFGVPDVNGEGYAQGVSLGVYLALLAGVAATMGGVFEGIKAAQERLVAMESEPADDDGANDEPASAPAKASAKPAAIPKPLDPEEERRRKLTDW